MPVNYIDAAKWMNIPCYARSDEKISRFLIHGKDASDHALDDWLPSYLPWLMIYEDNLSEK